jgi:hypothetical protein
MPDDAGATLVIDWITGKEIVEKHFLSQNSDINISNLENTVQADLSGNFKMPVGFVDKLWQSALGFIAFYWLTRWIFPSILPESLRTLGYVESSMMCLCIAVVWVIIRFIWARLKPIPKY